VTGADVVKNMMEPFSERMTLLKVLRQYWREYKLEKWLFEGARADRYI